MKMPNQKKINFWEETRYCDACGEKWEETFFCENCSKGWHVEVVEVPNLMWSGWPSHEETEMEEEWVPNGDICLNCCMCWVKEQG
jgi:hypothetical protein